MVCKSANHEHHLYILPVTHTGIRILRIVAEYPRFFEAICMPNHLDALLHIIPRCCDLLSSLASYSQNLHIIFTQHSLSTQHIPYQCQWKGWLILSGSTTRQKWLGMLLPLPCAKSESPASLPEGHHRPGASQQAPVKGTSISAQDTPLQGRVR